jgi:large subunit ribosomal protein L1
LQIKLEKAGVVNAGIGKASFSAKQIKENMKALVGAVSKAKPSDAKRT